VVEEKESSTVQWRDPLRPVAANRGQQCRFRIVPI